MKYLLISHTGVIKEYYRLPSSIDPRDVLVELNGKKLINHIISLGSTEVDEDKSNIPEREMALSIAAKLGIIKKAA